MRAKLCFERDALRNGVFICGYRGDNGVYKSAHFKQACSDMNQTLDFSGVGAHHHNGVAERSIRTISTSACTMLLHSMLHWPQETTLDLWPFAVDYAVYIWNRLPRQKSGLSPMEIFYSTKSTHEELLNAKVWGCPVYVLEPTLQDGKKLPQWQPRSKLGQFLGQSKVHASSVGLIKNLQTGKISSQFHVVYDDHFTTLEVNTKPEDMTLPKEWVDLFAYNREKHVNDADAATAKPLDSLAAKTPATSPLPVPKPSSSSPSETQTTKQSPIQQPSLDVPPIVPSIKSSQCISSSK